jgi:CheY-like chemotaxis protein
MALDPSPAVLIVEDEPLMRMIAVDILSELGTPSYEAEDGDEALFMLAAHPGISVMFTDIQMPGGMDGIELARRVHELRPDIGIIVTSGRQRPPHSPLPDRGIFLPKPYRAQQLLDVVGREMAHIG